MGSVMALLSQRSPGAASLRRTQDDATISAILEFSSPSAAIIAATVPLPARGTVWAIGGLLAACLLAMGLIPVDRVVTAPGRVVSRVPTIVVQPLETSIVRAIEVTEGESVHAGDLLARLDPTFTAADVGASKSEVSAFAAEVSRLEAEAAGRPFIYEGADPNLSLQAAIYAQRQSERKLKRDTYQQRISGLQAAIDRSAADVQSYRARLAVADQVLNMRKTLERLQVGTVLNSLAATDNQLEIARGLSTATQTQESARRDLEAMAAERDTDEENWRIEVSQKLSEQRRRLADAQQQLSKAQLRRQLVELRASRDATVLTIAKVSVGSVVQTGEQLITLVPADVPLEVEANILGRDDAFVRDGAPVAIKFDSFPFSLYGLADGRVRTISADSFTQNEGKTRAGAASASSGAVEPFYRARITLDAIKLHDVPADFKILPGMPVTADIKVGKRTVLAYLLGRILPATTQGMREP
jgi:hemolysin D